MATHKLHATGNRVCATYDDVSLGVDDTAPCPRCEALESWEIRELSKFNSGEYKAPAWASEEWAAKFAKHYAHVSVNDASKIAYTESAEKGALDRQTVCKPGRYLAKYASDFLPPHVIADYAARHLAAHVPPALKLATDEQTIEYVYANGPRSCMAGNDAVRAYAAGDLAIAYLEPKDGDVTARAICWPSKRIFGRIYGDENRLALALDVAGYSEASNRSEWRGAKLLKIEVDSGRYACPYLDIADTVSVSGEFLIVGGGDYSARDTSGIIGEPERTCDNCNDEISEDDSCYDEHANQDLCPSCYSERFVTCAGRRCRSDAIYRDDAIEVGRSLFCSDCADEIIFVCEECEERADIDAGYTVDERHLCEGCASDAKRCDNCGDLTQESTVDTHDGDTYCQNCEESCAFTCKGCYTVFSGKAAGGRCDDCIGAIAVYKSRLPVAYVAPSEPIGAWRGPTPKLDDSDKRDNGKPYPLAPGDILALRVGADAWVITRVTHSDAQGYARGVEHAHLGKLRAPMGKVWESLGAGRTRLDLPAALEAIAKGPTFYRSSADIGETLRRFIK